MGRALGFRFRRILTAWMAVFAVCACASAPGPLGTQGAPVEVVGVEDPDLSAVIAAALADIDVGDTAFDARQAARRAADRAVRVLRSQGYYGGAVVSVPTEAGARPRLRVRPGPRYQIGAIDVAVDAVGQAPADSLLKPLVEIGDPVAATRVFAAEADLVATLQEAGWPDAEAGDRRVIIDHDTRTAEIIFAVNAGAYSEFGAVRLDEPTDYRPSLARTLAPFQTGDTARASDIRAFRGRLNALTSVAVADVTLAEPTPATARRDVFVTLTERPKREISLGAGVSTSEGPRVEGRWRRRNVASGDETVTVAGEVSGIGARLSADLSAPHWRRYAQTATVGLGAEVDNTDAFDRTAGVIHATVLRPVRMGAAQVAENDDRPAWTATLDARAEAADVRDVDGRVRVTTAALAAGLVRDSRDNVADPRRGLRLEARVTPTLVGGDESTRYVGVLADGRAYRPIGLRSIIAARVAVSAVRGASSSDLPADDRLYVGGGGSVRGYEFQALSPVDETGQIVGGLSAVETAVELRHRFGGARGLDGVRAPSSWGAVVFVDAGAADRSPDITPDDLRVGYGAGVRYFTAVGPIRFDIAAPADRRGGEPAIQAYVSLGQAF